MKKRISFTLVGLIVSTVLLAQDSYLYRYGIPALQKNDGTTQYISHSASYNGHDVLTYCLEFDYATCHPRWVSFYFDAEAGYDSNCGRTSSSFFDDPDLPTEYQIGSKSFRASANTSITWTNYNAGSATLDRGHMCSSDERQMNAAANLQTFYMSNMSPMLSTFN